MRTAREAFLQSAVLAEFGKMADTRAMDVAAEYALLTFLEELPAETDPNAAWTQHAKVVGARRVLDILRTLHLKQEPPKPYRPPQLKPPS